MGYFDSADVEKLTQQVSTMAVSAAKEPPKKKVRKIVKPPTE